MDHDNDDQFVVQGPALRAPRLDLDLPANPSATLAELVEQAAKHQLDLDISFIGLISLHVSATSHELLAVAVLRQEIDTDGQANELRKVTLRDIEISGVERDLLPHFVNARHRRTTERAALGLGTRIHKAFEDATDVLQRRSSQDDSYVGWSQYLDGQTVGLVSTAQGILACIHAGKRDELVEKAARTIEALQNADGGWEVRRALVGGVSHVSVTESTSLCLTALLSLGRGKENPIVKGGTDWLVANQATDGGWTSSASVSTPQTFATALAVSTLILAKNDTAVQDGLAWLRRAQNTDGGWGRTENDARSQPIYTAHAVIALRAGGMPADDPAMREAARYLESHFDPGRAEPWQATSTNYIVDAKSGARLDYRHFTTPWVLVALTSLGLDIGHPTILVSVGKLLDLQKEDGTWACSQTADDVSAVWALYDSVRALRTVIDAGAREVTQLAAWRVLESEKAVMQAALLNLLRSQAVARPRTDRGVRVQVMWLSCLTVVVVLLVTAQFGLLDGLATGTTLGQAVTAFFAAVIAVVGAFGPPLAAQEFRFRRDRREAKKGVTTR